MGHFFLVFGLIVALIAGFSMNKEKEAHQAAIAHQEKLQAEQMYDAGLVHLSDKQVRIKDGQAKVTIHVSANTTIKIHSSHEQLHDLDYKPIKEKKDIRVTFVMPGKYTVTATRGQTKVVKHIMVLKNNHKKATSSTSPSSSSELVESESSSETIVKDPTESEETSSETVVDPSIADTATTDTGVTDVTPSTDYQPGWTPSESTPQTGGGTNGTTNNSSDSAPTTSETSESATTATTSTPDEQSDTARNIGE